MNQEGSIEQSLNQILTAVDCNKRPRWVETVCTLLLSLTTLGTAWCVYQSNQWSGEQYFRIEDSSGADRQRLMLEINAMQKRSFDAGMFISYATAYSEGNNRLAGFLRERFRPEFKKAADAWEATKPQKNPAAPKSPFEMSEYVLAETENAAWFREQAATFRQAANQANRNSGNYVLLTIIFALALFLSGMAGLTTERFRQKFFVFAASLIFIITLIVILRIPVLF